MPTEAERREIQEKLKDLDEKTGDSVVRLIRTLFPKRLLPSVPSAFKRRRVKKAFLIKNDSAALKKNNFDSVAKELFTLVWRRNKLPASSVEIAGSANTNPTGGLRLVQDKFQIDGTVIDQATYFRNTVFGDLPWATEKMMPFVEKSIGKFYVSILGEDLGMHALEIRHKPTGEAGQHNYTTSISWGGLSKIIRDKALTGRALERVWSFNCLINSNLNNRLWEYSQYWTLRV